MIDGGVPEETRHLHRPLPDVLECMSLIRVTVFVVWNRVEGRAFSHVVS